VSWLNVLPTLLVVVASQLATGTRLRRAVAATVGLSSLVAPYLLPPDWLGARGTAAMMSFIATLRIFDLVRRQEPTTPLRRLAHAFSLADSFRLRRVPRTFHVRSAVKIAVFGALAIGARAIAYDLAPQYADSIAHYPVRWLGGLGYAYAGTEVAYAIAYLIYRALGFDPQRLHHHPALSRSIREFWGLRWNRIVGAWLDASFFRPFARRGKPVTGMMLAFVFSACAHIYIALPGLGWRWALIVGLYFVIQGLFALLEGPLKVARWPRLFAHAWTITIMVVTSPLMCEPFLVFARHWPK
jgi:Membrane bound O-acyl transferase family